MSAELAARVEDFAVAEADAGTRLDRLLAARLPELSRSYLQELIARELVLVDGRGRKASYRLAGGEHVVVALPAPSTTALVAEPIALRVVYEDEDVVVIDKPAGMVVHPAPGHERGTLVNALLAHAPEARVNGSRRPGIVHRLDKETSGLLIVAKQERALAMLQTQFQQRRAHKRYRALLDGVVEPDEGTIDAPLARDPRHRQRMAVLRGGREAISHFTVLERFPRHTLVDVRIESGRTHQIRVHCAFIGHPVTGDPLYGRGPRPELKLDRQFLHAWRLGVTLPSGQWHEFESPLPADLVATLDLLREQARRG